ncbi:plexin-D1 isoform X1 [Hemiscyllium ocellatum]|uniref:plexin-D1 isoform X1 n=1 Tax=Hemiscyllium ocellatum TaxID=170820 RepID=UPI0029673C37|nr:plexin-D1 isoform X1 [Hemiscyllium ocellatum]
MGLMGLALGLLIGLLVGVLPTVLAMKLEDTFRSSTPTNNLLVVGGLQRGRGLEPEPRVYVGAVNAVYQLGPGLRLQSQVKTGPVNDSALCHASQLPQNNCEHPRRLTDNYNKLLEADRAQGLLVVCGSVHQGFCQLRALVNISHLAVQFPPAAGTDLVFPSMLYVAANHPQASTVGLVLRGPGGGSEPGSRLLVAATYTGLGTRYFPTNSSREDLRFENTPEIAIRALDTGRLSRLFTYDINPSEDNVFKIKFEAKARNRLSFIRAFGHGAYTYLALNNDANSGSKGGRPRSLLARICAGARGPRGTESRKLTESYIQLGLRCSSDLRLYSRLLSVWAGPAQSLYGLFERPESRSGDTALCLFSFPDIERRIREARRKCFEEDHSQEVMVLDSVIQGSGPACVRRNITLQNEQLDCGAAHLQHPLSITKPLTARPIYTDRGLTSVAVSSVNNHTVVFLGTVSGQLLKLNLRNNLSIGKRELLYLAPGEAVHHIMHFDPADESYLYVMTTYQVSRVKVATCGQYQTCQECLAADDAHCGWCTLESRCSLQQDCVNSSEPLFWTSLSSGVQLCPSMSIVPSEIDAASVAQQNIGITIHGNVPQLIGRDVYCVYGDEEKTPVTAYENNSSQSQLVHCPFLKKDKYSMFLVDKDHALLTVAIEVLNRPIMWGNLTIYNCEKTGQVYPKTACRSCLQTKWACFWCVTEHRCVSDRAHCHGLSLGALSENSSHCPQVIPTDIDPVPTGGTLDISVSLVNSQLLKDTDLRCEIGHQQYRARWLNSSQVLCEDVTLFTLNRSRLFPVQLRLSGDHRFIDNPTTTSVEVYNCEVGRSDCSACWGRVDWGHKCAWCMSTKSCKLRSECGMIEATCPAPKIHQIEPLTGPVDGGTLLTIRGQNLGRRFSDIESGVCIGEVACVPVQDSYIVSEQIVCSTNGANQVFTDSVTVKVHKEGHSSQKFSFLLPEIGTLYPDQGPKAGGTRITINGTNLHIGSALRVLVNGAKDCTSLKRTGRSIVCVMPSFHVTESAVPICVQFEKKHCLRKNMTFWYRENPLIEGISPNTSYVSGGRRITVTGQRFRLAQSILMVIEDGGKAQSVCIIESDSILTCPSPPYPVSTVNVHFEVNGIRYKKAASLARASAAFTLHYYNDPHFYRKEKLIKHHKGEPLTLVIEKIQDNLNLAPEEYKVMIGSFPCDIYVVKGKIHCSVNVSLESDERQLPVSVHVGKYNETIAMVQLSESDFSIIMSIVVCVVLLLACAIALVVFCTKSRRAERYRQKTLLQMEEMEAQIREEIRKGFAELQTDMTDLTKELNRSQGIPFLEYRYFVIRTFFPKCSIDSESQSPERFHQLTTQSRIAAISRSPPETHPLLQPDWKVPENCRQNMEEGISLFSFLLNNKHFLISFVHALEQQKDFAVRDRCNLASLLTIALHGKLEYYTSIMKELLVDLIDASASKNPKLMLRRTESVVEKMLTNWMSICMYSFLKDTVGEPFFLLLCAMKQQINKGSVDAITGKARYTLNEEWLLRENIEARPMNLNVSFQGCGMDSITVRVMDSDSISQVKEKILEGFYKNVPFSQWPRVEDVDLEWFASSSDSRILRDLDNTSVMEDGRKKLNTLAHCKVPDGASLAMSLKDKWDGTLGRVKDLDTEKYFHLVLPNDELIETKKSHKHSHRKKVLPEIYLTRLLSTKGTLQKFLDDLFRAVLSIHAVKPPFAVKYFFDFLEEQAEKRGTTDPDTLHIWKTNSLPLRFWVNILKNPQFVFDVEKTDHMDACLSVIAQAFIDACSISDLQLGKDSPTNKLLYAKEIPEYKKAVQRYYREIQEMITLSEQEMNAHLAEESRKHQNEFNTNFAMAEIYKYAKRYRGQVMNALESNSVTRRMQFQHKFEQVIALMEDNIYECCSEA